MTGAQKEELNMAYNAFYFNGKKKKKTKSKDVIPIMTISLER
jgi:hypothetical protein